MESSAKTDNDLWDFFPIAHKVECEFYELIAPHLPEMPLPKVFRTKEWIRGEQEGIILMEDLSEISKTMSFHETFNIHQLKNIVRHMAHFHTSLMLLEDNKWRNRIPRLPVKEDFFPNFINGSAAKLYEIAGADVFEDLIRRLQPFIDNGSYDKYALERVHKEIGLHTTLIIGDCWTNNIMWKTNADGSVSNEVQAFIDWQVMREGSPMADIARVLTLCCDAEVRIEAESFILDLYVDTLKEGLKKAGRQINITVEQVEKAYKHVFLQQALHFIFMVPLYNSTRKPTESDEMWTAR
jgi:thiamine kinase-like enzyme